MIWLISLSNTALSIQKANLPDKSDVKPKSVMPIDGVWTISSIDKRIKIDRGRAYAIDSWAHLGLFEIKKGMVVIKDIKKKAVSNYTGYDLPLLGSWNAVIQANRNLKVTVGLVSYELIPERLKSRKLFEEEMIMAGLMEKSSNPSSDDESYTEDSEQFSEEDFSEAQEEDEQFEDENYSNQFDEEESEDTQFDEEEYDQEEFDEEKFEEEYAEGEEALQKIKAKIMGPLRVGCVGKQNYLSGGACWSCPDGYKRTSPARKMSHPQACKERGLGFNKKTTKAKKLWEPAFGCPKGQFGHLNKCKKCPEGTKRIAVAGFDSGNCKYLD